MTGSDSIATMIDDLYVKRGAVELRVFHASGYTSLAVPGDTWLDAALQARFDHAKVRELKAIDWSNVHANGDCWTWWRWTSDGR